LRLCFVLRSDFYVFIVPGSTRELWNLLFKTQNPAWLRSEAGAQESDTTNDAMYSTARPIKSQESKIKKNN